MRLLLIHTARNEGSVALAAEREIVAAEVLPGRSSSERLVPAVRRLMELRGWNLRDLKAVVVVHGPGSFTGVRVGLSAAKGLSEAGGIPLIAISRLALLAASVGEGDAPVHAVLDAGRGEFYYGEYAGHRCVRESLLSHEEVSAAVGGGLVVVRGRLRRRCRQCIRGLSMSHWRVMRCRLRWNGLRRASSTMCHCSMRII